MAVKLYKGLIPNLTRFRTTLRKAWHYESLTLRHTTEGVYQVFLGSEDTVNHVLMDGPWNTDHYLLQVRSWIKYTDGDEDLFAAEDFSIHVVGLPRYCYT